MSLHAARRVVVWTSAQVVAGVRQRAAVGGLYGAHVQHPAAAAVLWRSRRGALPSMRSCHTLVGEGADTTEGNAVEETPDLKALTPSQLAAELDRFIVGQQAAKRAVAIALRERFRRMHLRPELRDEVVPKNILMIGPTGCGKTEIARRLAKLVQAPFVKVEATKYTEVGYHGQDVDAMIADLVEASIRLSRKKWRDLLRPKVEARMESTILDLLIGPTTNPDTRSDWLKLLREGQLEDREVEVLVMDRPMPNSAFGVMADAGNVTRDQVHEQQRQMAGDRRTLRRKCVPVKEGRKLLFEHEMEKELETVDIVAEAVRNAEQHGIVFIDEVDKLCANKTSLYRGASPSDEGVQKDLLPLIEGCAVKTKFGNVNTNHILFVASGAFHSSKPADLVPELQGRLPIRVELHALGEAEFVRILMEPEFNLIRQQVELLAVENVTLQVTDEAIRAMARIAAQVNRLVENIGARRLHTVIERVMGDISFEAADMPPGSTVVVDAKDVEAKLAALLKQTDLSKYIL